MCVIILLAAFITHLNCIQLTHLIKTSVSLFFQLQFLLHRKGEMFLHIWCWSFQGCNLAYFKRPNQPNLDFFKLLARNKMIWSFGHFLNLATLGHFLPLHHFLWRASAICKWFFLTSQFLFFCRFSYATLFCARIIKTGILL